MTLERLLKSGNEYAAQSHWSDFALVKLCLGTIGFLCGILFAGRVKAKTIVLAVLTALASAVVLIRRFLPILKRNLGS